MIATQTESRTEAQTRLDTLDEALRRMVYEEPKVRLHRQVMCTTLRMLQTGNFKPFGQELSTIPIGMKEVDALIRRDTRSLLEIQLAYTRLFLQAANHEHEKLLREW